MTCAASKAGYVEYKSLPGTIETGCQLSPMRISKYCFNHAPRVSKVCAQDCTSTSESTGSVSEEGIVKVLLAKKVTRNSILYQVLISGVTRGGGAQGARAPPFALGLVDIVHRTASSSTPSATPNHHLLQNNGLEDRNLSQDLAENLELAH